MMKTIAGGAILDKSCEHVAYTLWTSVHDCCGDNPFLIAAKQGISIIVHNEEEESLNFRPENFSHFKPEEMSIDIYIGALTEFWQELYPGCPFSQKFKYACWRELWKYWAYNKFAPLYESLGNQWKHYLRQFANLSSIEQEYFSHYFAGLATGVIAWDP